MLFAILFVVLTYTTYKKCIILHNSNFHKKNHLIRHLNSNIKGIIRFKISSFSSEAICRFHMVTLSDTAAVCVFCFSFQLKKVWSAQLCHQCYQRRGLLKTSFAYFCGEMCHFNYIFETKFRA